MTNTLTKFLLTIFTTMSILLFARTETDAQFVINEIIKKMDEHQKNLSTLRSKIVFEKYTSQLNETDITYGQILYFRLDGNRPILRIDWIKPLTESLSLINSDYVLYRPRLGQAIVGKIVPGKEIKALAFLKMSKKEIRNNYAVKYINQEEINETPVWHLEFKPKKPTVYISAELWVNGNGMLIRAKVIEPNSDITITTLSDFEENESIKISKIPINLPKGTKLIKASGTEPVCFKPANAKDALENWSGQVFSGKITAVNDTNYTFKTERIWKGIVGAEAFIGNLKTQIKPIAGEKYLIFARQAKMAGNPVFVLMPCNYTRKITAEDEKKILKEIGPGKLFKADKNVNKRSPLRKSRKRL